jgi:hypothetical protein
MSFLYSGSSFIPAPIQTAINQKYSNPANATLEMNGQNINGPDEINNVGSINTISDINLP